MARFLKTHSWMNTTSDQAGIDGDEIIRTLAVERCGVCGELTEFASISFQAYYCSSECLEKEWQSYFDHLQGKKCSNCADPDIEC